MSLLLANQRIVVTGAARGLGRHFAEAIGQAGAKVIICDILRPELAQTQDQLQQQGLMVESYLMDLANPASIEQAFSQIAQQGAIDGLVNNAALATGVGGQTLEEYDIGLWDKVMTVNVRGTWLVSKAAVPLLSQQPHGKIVNIASDTTLWGAPRLLAYVASKGAIISMTRSMARELGEQRICVNAIAPGLTKVEATDYVPLQRHQLYQQGRALQGEQHPADISGTVIYLLSSLADFVTGQLIPVNGGFVFH